MTKRNSRFVLQGFLIVLIALMLYGCSGMASCSNGKTGKLVDSSGLDGCGWLIELGNGDYLQPLNLKDHKLQLSDGMSVKFDYDEIDTMGGICMKGKIVRLSCIREVK